MDIFPLTEDNPIRIEMWGDEIDTIRTFDTESQKSIENIDEIKENIASLQAEMMEAAQNLQFERAAELRDKIKQLEERINS